MSNEFFIVLSVAIGIPILGWLINYFGFIIRISERLARIETKTNLFWGMVEDKLANSLHSPTHFVKDNLLAKLTTKNINNEEIVELLNILQGESNLEEKKDLALNYCLVISHLEVMQTENYSNGKNK